MTQTQNQQREALEEFLHRFFGPGNGVWPNLDPDYRHKDRTLPFVEAIRRGDNAPTVLPRVYTDRDRFVVYVISREPGERAKTAELIRAFAGPTYIAYDEQVGIQPAWLDPDDPVEQAIRDFAGDRTTFRLETGRTLEHRRNLVGALELMQRTEARRPPRMWRVSKPIGRLLAEFDASLSAGAEAASNVVLDHLAAAGGVTAANLTNLRIKRLDRLGRSEEILQLSELPDAIRQNPPLPVKEAILNAVYAALEEPLAEGDLPSAQARLEERGRFVPALLDADAGKLGTEAVTVLLMAATILEDLPALHRLVEAIQNKGRVDELPSLIWDDAQRVLAEGDGAATPPAAAEPVPQVAEDDASESLPAIDSWPAFLAAVAAGSRAGKSAVEQRSWTAWSPPAVHDADLAGFLDGLENQAAEEAWRAVGAFIDADGYVAPAGLTAHAFIRNAVAFDRFGPGDLAALQALTEIALRTGPSAHTYAELLDEIGAYSSRWVSPERASIALDFVDRLFLVACPDEDARTKLACNLLEPLCRHQGRLNEADLAFAKRLSGELGVGFSWQERAGTDDERELSLSDLPPMKVLLYSLDDAVLTRCAEEIKHLAPAVDAAKASDYVGSTQLRQKARSADLIVIATRCAKHAATGYITQHARTEHIHYADGSGSASMLRAAVAGLRSAAVGR
ncbi:protein DpdD [Streptomyces sp. NBC_01381]|uniref:protein DpdD n=1 Tax=Streptomyces sp. NBC_01381 TaxID=2903845 RepID=UPI00225ABCC5|nr:protein DpdD [Streptomyces sp. NBC_01381]MCX4666515.1 protein DpdD [Streptomyces sp. NBC_01381]